jgi:hypothetical protein
MYDCNSLNLHLSHMYELLALFAHTILTTRNLIFLFGVYELINMFWVVSVLHCDGVVSNIYGLVKIRMLVMVSCIDIFI